MKRILFFIFFLSLIKVSCSQILKEEVPSIYFNNVSERADALLEECIYYRESVGIVSGLSTADSIIWRGAAGFMNLEQKIYANVEMRHRIASIAKPMTAIAILQLYERNKLNLDSPIQNYLPYFPKQQHNITIRHLLQHTSGLDGYGSYEESAPIKNYESLKAAIDIFKNRPLNFSPGTAYGYTTYGYVVLGAIVEAVSGLSFRDYMKENIWDKSGMTNTDVEIYGKEYENKSKLYYKNSFGGLVKDKITNLSSKVPGGGFYSTVEDLLKFGQAVLNNTLIKHSTFNIMILNPEAKKKGNPYAMGWFIYGDEDNTNGRIIGHTGSQAGTSSYFQIFLDKKIVVATLSNTAEVNNPIKDVTDKLVNNLLQPENINKPLKQVITLEAEVLKEFEGEFEKNNRTVRVFKENETLFATINGRFKSQLYPSSKDNFFLRWGDLNYEFIRNDKGEIKNLLIIENGKPSNYQKIVEKQSLAIAIETLIEKNAIDEALKLLDDPFIKKYKQNLRALINLGFTIIKKGKPQLSITYFEKLLGVFPDTLEIYEGIGKAKLELGNTNEAKAMFIKASPVRASDGFYQMAINPPKAYAPTKISKNPKDLFEYRGNLDRNEVFIFLQGGPDPFLSIDNRRDPFYSLLNRDNILRVYPYQSQMLNHTIFSPKSKLTLNDAIFERQQSAEILHRTIRYFKKQGKRVFVFTHSFGSQIILEYLEGKPNTADAIVLMGGKLDNTLEDYPDLPPGKLIRWRKGVEPIVSTWHNDYAAMPLIEKEFYQVIQNTKQLVTVHRKKKFTTILKDKILGNITFVHAKFDESSGRQNEDELTFLKSKGVVTIGTYGNHHSMLSNTYMSGFVNAMLQKKIIKPSLAYQLSNYIEKDGLKAALEWYKKIEENDCLANQDELNTLGYDLVSIEKQKEAIEVFKINTQLFPNSWNVYDSLGEAYLANGEKELSILNYKKSLQINPTNTYAINALKKLNVKGID